MSIELIPAKKDNFSYENIPFEYCTQICENQQMIVHWEIEVSGELIIDGTLVILD